MLITASPITSHKTICEKITPPGWIYGGFVEGFYFFQTGSYRTGFKVMDCLVEDLTAENLALMAKMGVTRDRSATRVRAHHLTTGQASA